MVDPRQTISQISLAHAVFGFVAVTCVLLSGFIWLLISSRSEQLTTSALDNAVRLRTESAAENLARTLHSDWHDLQQLASMIGTHSDNEITALMAGLQGDGSRISWVGLADTAGNVRYASGNMLVGQDVSSRPWFRGGLRGGFAGDVHEAVLLASLLPETAEGEVPRFIDLALPVRDGAGEVTGVLGMHIDAAWLKRQLSETAETLNIDLFLVAADGSVSLWTTEADPGSSGLAIMRAAQAGVAASDRETWPDGKDYFSILVPSVTYDDLPNFGWRVVGRLEAASFAPAMQDALGTIGAVVLSAISLLAGLTAIFVYLFVRPIEALAQTATRIANGDEEFPPERGNTREIAQLSAAVARIQEQRDYRPSAADVS